MPAQQYEIPVGAGRLPVTIRPARGGKPVEGDVRVQDVRFSAPNLFEAELAEGSQDRLFFRATAPGSADATIVSEVDGAKKPLEATLTLVGIAPPPDGLDLEVGDIVDEAPEEPTPDQPPPGPGPTEPVPAEPTPAPEPAPGPEPIPAEPAPVEPGPEPVPTPVPGPGPGPGPVAPPPPAPPAPPPPPPPPAPPVVTAAGPGGGPRPAGTPRPGPTGTQGRRFGG
jgi:hypothetical protein